MTGYRSEFFRYNCDERSCYYKQLPKWDDLIGCFPRGIRPTDVDGMVEINGNFLFLEEKGAGVPLPPGQRSALRKLSRRPGITVAFFRPPGLRTATDLECLVFNQKPAEGWKQVGREGFKDWLREWAWNADRHAAGEDAA